MLTRPFICTICLMMYVWPACAEETPAENQVCIAHENFSKFIRKVSVDKPEHRDTVDSQISGYFAEDGEKPDRLFLKLPAKEMDLVILPSGIIENFNMIKTLKSEFDVCFEDERIAEAKNEGGSPHFAFNMGFKILFHNRSGSHTFAELRDGAKDGKRFYKRMVSAPLKLLVPTMTHVTITYDDPEQEADIWVQRGDGKLSGLQVETFGGNYVVSFESLKALGADSLYIGGGPYTMRPSPSIEKMKKLGFGGDEEQTQDERSEDQNMDDKKEPPE